VVLFAHGAGSSRHSPRNRAVSETLHARALGTVLVDLVADEEEPTGAAPLGVDEQADRLAGIVDWLAGRGDTGNLPLGLFGASTGAAAALLCAAARPGHVRAVVSRGGRPDLAGPALAALRAPTLLVVGSHDEPVIELNQDARTAMTAHNELVIVPGASHLFSEPGTLEEVAERAADWFDTYLFADD